MLIPIRCYTCGKVLADKDEYYERELLKKKLAMGNTEEDPLIININASDVKKTIAGEIMDELGLINPCCRKIVLTSLKIIDEI